MAAAGASKLSVWIGVVGIGAVVALATLLAVYRRNRRKAANRTPPEQWTKAGTITQIMVYPMKSCKGESLKKAQCTTIGLKHKAARDRIFAIMDQKNRCITMRDYPRMALIEPSCTEGELRLDAPDMPTLSVPLPRSFDEVDQGRIVSAVRLFGDLVSNVIDCGEKAGQWLSTYLTEGTKELRLLYHLSNESTRKIDAKFAAVFENLTEDSKGAFSDDGSYMVLTDDSVNDLNKRLVTKHKDEVTPLNFRPSILINAGKPYVENEWKWLKIGGVIFQAVMPCTRCVVTTINPETGQKDPQMEPLRTLKGYRQVTNPIIRRLVGESPMFGAFFKLHSVTGSDVIHAGDDVFVSVET